MFKLVMSIRTCFLFRVQLYLLIVVRVRVLQDFVIFLLYTCVCVANPSGVHLRFLMGFLMFHFQLSMQCFADHYLPFILFFFWSLHYMSFDSRLLNIPLVYFLAGCSRSLVFLYQIRSARVEMCLCSIRGRIACQEDNIFVKSNSKSIPYKNNIVLNLPVYNVLSQLSHQCHIQNC